MSLLEKGIEDDEDLKHYDRSLSKEALRVVEDIRFGVEAVNVSNVLENNDSFAYINLKTLENNTYCIEITASGYRIVSNQFDMIKPNFKNEYEHTKFESYEPLMHKISPMFVEKFNNLVADRLNSIK